MKPISARWSEGERVPRGNEAGLRVRPKRQSKFPSTAPLALRRAIQAYGGRSVRLERYPNKEWIRVLKVALLEPDILEPDEGSATDPSSRQSEAEVRSFTHSLRRSYSKKQYFNCDVLVVRDKVSACAEGPGFPLFHTSSSTNRANDGRGRRGRHGASHLCEARRNECLALGRV